MPGAVVAAVAGAAASELVGVAVASAFPSLGVPLFGSVTGASIFGAVAGGITSSVVGAAFTEKPQTPETDFGSTFGGDSGLNTAPRDRLITVRQPISPWQIIYGQARVGGTITYEESTPKDDGTANYYLHIVVTLAGHEVDEIGDVYFDDEVLSLDGSGNVTNTRFSGNAVVLKSLGAEADGVQPFPSLQSASAGKWTSSHRQTGRAKLYVRLSASADSFPTGVPNITAVVKGRKVYDPRTGLTVWSNNAALCIADYLTADFGVGAVYADEIDETQLIAAANICDESVTLADATTESRYLLDGAFPLDRAPRDILGSLLTAMDGKLYFLGGQWKIVPAAYVTPTETLTLSELRGPLRVTPRLSRRELANRVKGVYSGPDTNYQPTDYPPVTNATYLAEDNDEEIWRELNLPFTKSAAACQRIAKIELERTRQQISVSWPGKLSCYRLQPGDTVQLTIDHYGWSSKVFEVMSVSLVVEDGGEGPVLGCDLELRETASAVYTWSAEETTVDPAPDTNLPDPWTVSKPGVPTVTDELVETRDGRGVAVKATFSCGASSSAFVRSYQFEYRVNGASTWTVLPPQSGTTVDILDIASGRYDVRVKAISELGVSSAYATATAAEIVGEAAVPSAITGLAIQAIGGQALITFTQPTELDVLRGGRIRVRHCEDTASPTWESSFSIGNELGYPGDSVYVLVPLKAGTYLLKAEDAGGRQSSAATITTRQASVLTFSTLGSVTEDPTFSGTHSSTVAIDSTLKLTGAGLFDDIADFDTISSLDDYGGVNTSGTYTFSAGIDLGSVQNVRLTGKIVGLTVNVNDLFDDRSGNIDDWLDFDGTAGGGSADAYLEVRQTDDNPSGSPTWGSWVRLDAAEKRARAFQFRLQMKSNDVAYNEHVTQLRVTAEQVV